MDILLSTEILLSRADEELTDKERESMDNWDKYFFAMNDVIRLKSKDESTKVGCTIVGVDNEVRSTGCNSFPRGVNDDVPERQGRPLKYKWIEHAERNAIYNSARIGVPLKGCRIYMDWYPCPECSRAIIQSGIVEIVIDARDYDEKETYWAERWKEELEISKGMLVEAGIFVRLALKPVEEKEKPVGEGIGAPLFKNKTDKDKWISDRQKQLDAMNRYSHSDNLSDEEIKEHQDMLKRLDDLSNELKELDEWFDFEEEEVDLE